jgi:hypothetical protein
MNNFEKGDILVGKERAFEDAWHPIVFISGQEDAPLAVVLTHTGTEQMPCNLRLQGIYDAQNDRPQYFVGHLIQKMSEWGPYRKVGRLIAEDLKEIERALPTKGSITWAEYQEYTRNGCPDHKNSARGGSR